MDSMSLLNYLISVLILARDKIYDSLQFDFSELRFEDLGPAYTAGLFVTAVILMRLLIWAVWRSRKYFVRKYSGSFEYHKHAISRLFRVLSFIMKWLVLASVLFQIISLGDPHFIETRKEKVMARGRIRTEVRDTSGSMEGLFPGVEKTKAEIGEDYHLKFLKLREGKGDRVAFWLFASAPYLIQEFVANDEFYRLKVSNAPLITSGSYRADYKDPPPYLDEETGELIPQVLVPFNKYRFIEGEAGGTALTIALIQIINQFKTDPVSIRTDPKTNRLPDRAILIVTDAQVDKFPEKELNEIKRMGIKIYVIWIPSGSGSKPPALLDSLGLYGGKYWDVRTPSALMEAYREIDRLEPANYEEIVIETKKDISDVFLFYALISSFIVIMAGLAFLTRKGTGP